MVIILPNSFEKLTKRNQVKLESVRTLLKITLITSWKSYLAIIICSNSHEKLTKSQLGQVRVSSNIAQNRSSSQ